MSEPNYDDLCFDPEKAKDDSSVNNLKETLKSLKDELDISKKREEIAVACLCRLREQGNEDAIKTLEELLVR